MGRIEAGNGIIGRAYAGAPVMGQDNGYILAAPANVNILSYASPSIAGFTVGVSTTSAVGKFSGGSSATTGAAETVSVSYAAGPLSIGADYTNNAKRTRVSASYDLGVAKLGAGYEQRKVTGAGDGYAVGVSVPMGALTLGAAYSANLKIRDSSTVTEEGAAAFEVGAAYALSKRTTLSTAYVKHNSEAETATGAGYAYRVRMTHAF